MQDHPRPSQWMDGRGWSCIFLTQLVSKVVRENSDVFSISGLGAARDTNLVMKD